MDQERSFGCVGRSDQPQPVVTLLFRKSLLFVAGLDAVALRQEPDLVQVYRLVVRRIELAVRDAGACRHALELARPQHFAIAH
jgi:hypothetical protein